MLKTALTPPSAGLVPDNQRMEFLGDSVLHLCVSQMVYREHPAWPEGSLSKLRGLMVCTDALHEWALDLELELEQGPRSPRKGTANLRNALAPGARNALADAMEAILAAIFLDLQGQGLAPLEGVMRIVEGRFLQQIASAYLGIWETKDSKTTLQERGALLAMQPPCYELVERSGPDHAPTFKVRASMGGHEACACASTLKRAQMEAARILLLELPSAGTSTS